MLTTLTLAGRKYLAQTLRDQELFLALGTGDPQWDANGSPEVTNQTQLFAEIGRRKIIIKQFLVEDAGGDVSVDYGDDGVIKYSYSEDPTTILLLSTVFDGADASDQTIREVGVFANTEVISGLPDGQLYFANNEVVDRGDLFLLNFIPALVRSPLNSEVFQTVVTF